MWNPTTCDCKKWRIFSIKNCSCKKGLIGELVLECEDEILNATETSLEHIYWPVIFL